MIEFGAKHNCRIVVGGVADFELSRAGVWGSAHIIPHVGNQKAGSPQRVRRRTGAKHVALVE